MNPYTWPRWIRRILRLGVELEIEDATKDGDEYQVLRHTSRSRWTVWGVGLAWQNRREGPA